MNNNPSQQATESGAQAEGDREREVQNKVTGEARSKKLLDIVGLISQVAEELASIKKRTPSSVQKPEVSPVIDPYLKTFQNFKPPAFHGTGEPTIAENWLLKVGKILDSMLCPDDRRVALATFTLDGEAERWWQVQHRETFDYAPLLAIKWDVFVKVFRDWYVSVSSRLAMQDKFLNLIQGSRTVRQYETEFISLSRYTPQFVGTQEEKYQRFLRGLRDQLRIALATLDLTDFVVLVERVCRLETELSFSRQTQGQFTGQKRTFEREDNTRGKQIKVEPRQQQQQAERPQCKKCGEKHSGQCLFGTGRCFKCGESGHHKWDCPLDRKGSGPQGPQRQGQPQRYQEGSRFGRPRPYGRPPMPVKAETSESDEIRVAKARVFTFTPQEAKESEDVVTVGPGGSPDENGETTLDALLMNGSTMEVGAVAAMRFVKDGIKAAKLVMEHTEHTLIVGEMASVFAISMGLRGPSNLSSPESLEKWIRWKRNSCRPNFRKNVIPTNSCGPYYSSDAASYAESDMGKNRPEAITLVASQADSIPVSHHYHDTISMAVIDKAGRIAVGTSTNGATFKIPGRVGDGPIAGSSAYADDEVGACGATGDGDIMMRFLPCYQVVESMRQGMEPKLAAADAISRIVRKYPDFVGAIFALNKNGDHSGACHGWTFQYSVRTPSMEDVEVFTVVP